MSLPYIDADKIAEAFEFLRNGGDEAKAAAFLKCRVEDLPRLGLPVKSALQPAQQQSDEFDLFACDRLDGVM